MVVPLPILRPDTLKGIDDLIRAEFIAFRETCFNWLLAATGLVVVGLVFEGPELWHEISSITRHWRFRCRFHFSLPEEHTPNWAKLLAFVGWLPIVAGVAGEYVADSFASRADGYVQTFDEILLTETQNRTALASERASAAYERASENEKETAATLKQAQQERADAAKSLEVTKGYESQIAEAQRDAAESKRETETERLARVQLEKQIAGRRLSSEQINALTDRLKPGSGTPISIMSEAFDAEAADFAKDFETAFKAAGWKTTLIPWDQMRQRGLDTSMLADPSEPGKIPALSMPVVKFVHDAITAVGVSCRIFPLSPDDQVSLNKPEKNVLYLMVHRKPNIDTSRPNSKVGAK